MTASAKAWELRSKLFALANEFRDLHTGLQASGYARSSEFYQALGQADQSACDLFRLHDQLGDLFTDAAKDRPEYPFPLGERDHTADADFAILLRWNRELSGFSIPDLARASGLSDDAIRKWESGERQPTWDAVQKLATALGVTTDAFRTA